MIHMVIKNKKSAFTLSEKKYPVFQPVEKKYPGFPAEEKKKTVSPKITQAPPPPPEIQMVRPLQFIQFVAGTKLNDWGLRPRYRLDRQCLLISEIGPFMLFFSF